MTIHTATRPARNSAKSSALIHERRLLVRINHGILLIFMKANKVKTAYAVARLCGLKPGVVGHLVSGRRNTCSHETALKLSEGLGAPLDVLFDLEKSSVSTDRQRRLQAA